MSLSERIKAKIKQIGASEVIASILGAALYYYARLVYATNRWEFVGWPEDKRESGESFFVTFWHGHLLTPPFIGFKYDAAKKQKCKWYLLASLHRDGRIVAKTARMFGGDVIDGSAKKRGVAAGLAIIRLMEESSILFMAPDGRKPGYKLTKGIIRLASQAQKPVYLAASATSRGKRLKTWDRFFLPFPFGRGVVIFDGPVNLPADLTDEQVEEWRARLEKRLLALTVKAEERAGRKVSDFLKQEGV